MLLSNSKIDYSSVRRMPTVKIGTQTQGTPITTMPTATSLQDINTHSQRFAWNNGKDKDDRRINLSGPFLSSNHGRQLSASRSDERIFEHPEVTIKPSALDEELQRRLVTMKTSNTNENLLDRVGGRSAPNILEHPDMRSPVVMLSQQLSSSSSSPFMLPEHKRAISRTQSAEPGAATMIKVSSTNRVSFYIDNNDNSKQSVPPDSPLPEQQRISDSSTASPRESSQASSKPTVGLTTAKKNDSW